MVGVGISVGEHFETLCTLEASLVLEPTNSWEKKSRKVTWDNFILVHNKLKLVASISRELFVIFTVMFSHVLVQIRDCGECCFAIKAFSLALVYRHVLCVCILCRKPLIALFTLVSSLHGF